MTPTERLEQRLAEELHGRGAPHPELAAALVVARGRARAERAEWAAQLDLPEASLADAERGAGLPADRLGRLARLAPGVAWARLAGVDPAPSTVADGRPSGPSAQGAGAAPRRSDGDGGLAGATRRHPAGHRRAGAGWGTDGPRP